MQIKKINFRYVIFLLASSGYVLLYTGCGTPPEYDVLITNVQIVDGTGQPGYAGIIAINGDTIAYAGPGNSAKGDRVIDGQGLTAAPGFINMLSWATVSLLADGRGMSDIKQGVTLEVMGEGMSMGPLNPSMKEQMLDNQGDISFDISWSSLGEYLQHLEDKGVSPNVASYVGATTLRVHEVGYENRAPNKNELNTMKALAARAMEEGAMGLGSSLIYAPAFYAETPELIELSKTVSQYGGSYITHMRSEGNRLIEAVDEVLTIAKEANVQVEIYHLKAGGQNNWPKMDEVIRKLYNAQKEGIDVGTNMYNYVAGATGLDASMPPWVQEGGYHEWSRRLQDPVIRKQVMAEMKTDAQDWENLYYSAGGAENLLLVGFTNEALKKYTGRTLQAVSEDLGMSPEESAIELVIRDGSRVGTVYFLMSEENIKKQLKLPFMSFGSDAGAPAAEGDFLKSSTHPRAYGNFARLLGKYVREEGVIPLEEAIYKLTKLSAEKLKIKKRGELKSGFYADLVLFDAASIIDHATFEEPHQYATGVVHVFVNGEQVLEDGEHTGAKPGRFIKGPGYTGK